MSDVFDVLTERGLVQQCSNEEGLRSLLNSESVTYYCGFDPTGSSLQIGHLVPLMTMAHLQKAGHKPIALVGGGTARIGDPSGKTETRKMLTVKDINRNAECFRKQLSRFLDFTQAIMIDNSEWLADLNYIQFLREIGKHFSVNRMLSFEAYKQRMEKGLSFIEFNYQLLQSYDFLVLFRKHGCRLQVGGDDQWGNIVSGVELVRRVGGAEVFALTNPLIVTADGKKMGKSEKGALFLDKSATSPYDFYQYWINIPDADVRKFLLLFTFLSVEEIEDLARRATGDEINRAKAVLAFELTSLVHGEQEAEGARDASQAAFGRTQGFDREASLDLSSMPTTDLKLEKLRAGMDVITLFTMAGLCASKSEARRLIAQGGAYINGKNFSDHEVVVGEEIAEDGIIMLRAGKKRYHRILVKG